MRLRRVRLEHVRGVRACDVAFDLDGVTVVVAPNERGKSTLIDAVDLLLTTKASSRAQVVRDLKPANADVASTVEVELTIGGVELRCLKRFNREVATELELRGDIRASLTGDEAHDRLVELVSSHVDEPLRRALWLRQGRGLDTLPLRSATLARQLDAVAAGEDTASGDELLDRVEREYLRFHTPSGQLKKDPVGQAEARVAELTDACDDLAARIESIRGDVDALDALERQLPVRERELVEQLVPVAEKAQERLVRLQQARDRITQLRAEHDRVIAREQVAAGDRQRRHDDVERLTQLEQEVASLAEQVAPAAARLAELAERRDRARERFEQVESRRERLGRERDALQMVIDLVRARDVLHQAELRHDRVAEVVAAAATAEPELGELHVDDDALARIRAADHALRAVHAEADAAAPTVRVTAFRAVEGRLDAEAHRFDPSTPLERTVEGELTVQFDDVARVEVTAGAPAAELERRLDDARSALMAACQAAGVDDLDAAERALRRRDELVEVIRRRDETLRRELTGNGADRLTVDMLEADLANARKEVERLERLVDERAADVEPAEADARIREVRRELDAADAERDRARTELAERDAELDTARQAQARDTATLEQRRADLQRLGASLAQARGDLDDATLEQRLVESTQAVTDAASRLAAAQDELDGLDPDAIELDVDAADKAQAAAEAALAADRQRRVELAATLEALGAQGLHEEFDRRDAERMRANEELRHLRSRARAAELLRDTLQHARDELHDAYRAPLRTRIEQQARLLFDGEVAVELDDELRIVSRTLDGVTLGWGQLSAGAREQLAILSGLAAAQLAGDDGVPFVLDDVLGYTDPERIARLGALLGRTQGAQVIVLTCVGDRFRHTGARTVALSDAPGR